MKTALSPMDIDPKKIAFIVNGDPDDPSKPSLVKEMRKRGLSVDVINLAQVSERGGEYFIQRETGEEKIAPNNYSTIVRSIMGGIPGDTDKSLRLQKYLENYGVLPQISSSAIENIADKIKCGTLLQQSGPVTVPSIYVKLGELLPELEVEALGLPCIVKKSIGSGKGSVVIANTLEEVRSATAHYGSEAVPRGVVIQKYVPNMTQQIADYLEVDPANRSCHFRVTVINGEPFGANVLYSQPGEYSLNPEQGATSKSIWLEKLPEGVVNTALRAIGAFSKYSSPRVAAVDVILDEKGRPQVLDMNVSPNPTLTNERGKMLMEGIADDVRSMTLERAGRSNREL